MMRVGVKILDQRAGLPTFAHCGDACADIRALEDIIVGVGEVALMKTGLAVAVPLGYELVIRPRSGLSIKNHLTLVNSPGTVDATYRGEILVALRNDGQRSYRIRAGDRVAQVGIRPVPMIEWCEDEDLPPTERGLGGFGSTGR